MHLLAKEARKLDAQAREHKRLANAHRMAARAARTRQAEIEARCHRLGIEINYQEAPLAQGQGSAPVTSGGTTGTKQQEARRGEAATGTKQQEARSGEAATGTKRNGEGDIHGRSITQASP